jgi:hypothetical protein
MKKPRPKMHAPSEANTQGEPLQHTSDSQQESSSKAVTTCFTLQPEMWLARQKT